MKILFSPSEAKKNLQINIPIDKNSFIFPKLYEKRLEVLKIYDEFVKNASIDELKKLFGLKKIEDIEVLRESIFEKKTAKAIELYSGVAFDYLQYNSLDEKTQEYIDKNTIIFSNLFGSISASDLIPYYKLKQGEKIDSFDTASFYKNSFKEELNSFLKDETIVDLRASYYDKFYKVENEYLTFKFLKNGKSVSHYAKAYRGLMLREIALNQAKSRDDILNINFENLKFLEIKRVKTKEEFIFEITN